MHLSLLGGTRLMGLHITELHPCLDDFSRPVFQTTYQSYLLLDLNSSYSQWLLKVLPMVV